MPYTPAVYMRWLGPSTRVTGTTGICEGGVTVGSGIFGRGAVAFASDLGSGLLLLLPGVAGHDDRMRGVLLMA